MNSYNKTEWVNGSAPALNAENLNKLEQGIYDVTEEVKNNKVDKTRTVAGIDLQDDITAAELIAALNIKNAVKVQLNGNSDFPNVDTAIENNVAYRVYSSGAGYPIGWLWFCGDKTYPSSVVAQIRLDKSGEMFVRKGQATNPTVTWENTWYSFVPSTRTIAGIALTGNISASALMDALRPYTYKMNVTPNSSGIRGQLGIGAGGEVFYCIATDSWVHLASYEDLYGKMDLVADVDPEDIDDIEDGSIFFSGGTLYLKFDGDLLALPLADDVYTKTEIDSMIGNVEGALSQI